MTECIFFIFWTWMLDYYFLLHICVWNGMCCHSFPLRINKVYLILILDQILTCCVDKYPVLFCCCWRLVHGVFLILLRKHELHSLITLPDLLCFSCWTALWSQCSCCSPGSSWRHDTGWFTLWLSLSVCWEWEPWWGRTSWLEETRVPVRTSFLSFKRIINIISKEHCATAWKGIH